MISQLSGEESPASPASPSFSDETGLLVPYSAVVVVFLTIFMDTITGTISTPVMPFYALSFGASTSAIGWLYSSFNFAAIFGTYMLGRLADKCGRRSVMIISLVGEGVAALGQAAAPSFSALLAFRSFSGLWSSTMPIAKVYLGDVCSPAVLPGFLAKISQVPSLARTMGPGLGGGLSKFGLNFPILVDGVGTLATALLVAVYMRESPAGERLRRGRPAEKGQKGKKATPVPGMAYLLGLVQLLFSAMQGLQMSMMAISMMAKFHWDSLHVGFVQMAMCIVGLATGVLASPPLGRALGLKGLANAGVLLACLGQLGMGLAEAPALFLPAMALTQVGMCLFVSSSGTLQVRLADGSNRGTVVSTITVFGNMGSTVGPLVAGSIAARDPKCLIWLAGAAFGLLSALVLFCLSMPAAPETGGAVKLLKGYSDLGEHGPLERELGTEEDIAELGSFVGRLLSERRYRWVSRRQAVLEMLDLLLPELSEDGEKHREDMEHILQHAMCLRRAMKAPQSL